MQMLVGSESVAGLQQHWAASGGLPGLAGLGPGQEYQMAVTYRGAKVRVSFSKFCDVVVTAFSWSQVYALQLQCGVQHMMHMIVVN
jgi:hypothetical protein